MANTFAGYVDEDPSQPLRTVEGRDPTAQAYSAGPGLDVGMDISGLGLGPMSVPPPAFGTKPVASVSPAPAPPAPAPAAPAPAQGQTGLVAAWDASILPLLEKTRAEEQAKIDQLGREQAEQAERDRETTLAAQAEARAAGQEMYALAERQLQNRPTPRAPTPEPPVPQQRMRMFGEGPEKETGFQALNRIVSTLGLMAQMGMGMKSGYTQGAMAAFNGALKGWAEGNTIAAQQEWREYLANVEKMDREWAKDRQHFEDILRADAADMGKVQTKWMVKQAEMGYAKDLIALTGRKFDERYKLMNLEAQLHQRLLGMSMQANTAMFQAQLRQDMARQTDETKKQLAADRIAAENQRAADKIESQKFIATMLEGGRAQDRAWRHEDRLAAIAARNEKIGAQKQQMDSALGIAETSVADIEGLLADPKAKKVTSQYLGPVDPLQPTVGGHRAKLQRGAPRMFGTVAPEGVQLGQSLQNLRTYMRFLITGKQAADWERQDMLRTLPSLDSEPAVFEQELAATKRNIAILKARPNVLPEGVTGPAGGAEAPAVAPPAPSGYSAPPPRSPENYKGQSMRVGNDWWHSNGKTWTKLQKAQ